MCRTGKPHSNEEKIATKILGETCDTATEACLPEGLSLAEVTFSDSLSAATVGSGCSAAAATGVSSAIVASSSGIQSSLDSQRGIRAENEMPGRGKWFGGCEEDVEKKRVAPGRGKKTRWVGAEGPMTPQLFHSSTSFTPSVRRDSHPDLVDLLVDSLMSALPMPSIDQCRLSSQSP